MFSRFTEKAIQAIMLAQEEAKRFHHSYVGTEHILLALIAEEDGVAIRTIEKLDVDIIHLRNKTLNLIKENQEEILKDVSFDIKESEIVSLIGESGSGKSLTALSVIRLLEKSCKIKKGKIR